MPEKQKVSLFGIGSDVKTVAKQMNEAADSLGIKRIRRTILEIPDTTKSFGISDWSNCAWVPTADRQKGQKPTIQ